MVKKSIYTPAKGVRLSRKKLYKLKQLGGGLLETLFGGADDDMSVESPDDVQDTSSIDVEDTSSIALEDTLSDDVEEDTPSNDVEDTPSNDVEDTPSDNVQEDTASNDEGDKPGVIGTMMGTLDAVSASAKETLDDMTTGNDSSVVNLDSEESSVLLNKDDEIRRLREENTKLLEENRTLSLRLINQLDTKIDTLEKVDTVEEDLHAVQEDVDTALDTSVETTPENTPLNETPESEVQEEDDEGESSPDSDETPMDISLEEPDDLEDNSVPLTPREKALGGRKRKPKQNETRRKRK